MMTDKRKISGSDLQSMLMFGLILLFFLGVIFAYYLMLHSETRLRIEKTSELIATTAAEQIKSYLAYGRDTLEMACHTLDAMLREKRSQSEIKDFLVSQSASVANITLGNATGSYGLFNGEYLDGTGWVPDADFVPEDRPWYIDAHASRGQVTVVDPYLDLQTNTTTISFAKRLCDKRSVAALDFSLRPLQTITEELSLQSGSIEIVLDRKYHVIAHSRKSEVGKNYMADQGSLGNAIVNALRSSGKRVFSLRFGRAAYIVNTAPLAEHWCCISVFDATADFVQLNDILVFTILASFLVFSVLLFIMIRFNRRTRLAQQLREKAERATAANEAKSSFLSNMSHEIRTPINAVLGLNEMVLRESNETSVIEYSEGIRTAGNTLLGLINDILDFSKIEAGKMKIVPADYDLSTLINDLVNMIRTRADHKELLLRPDFDENIPQRLHGDDVRIKQVITNILTNAVKYTEKGSVTF
ncbi:MAG: hypothetical protein K6E38_05220, partial [Fretibacterium sp.]|nr:hypothetical protein [Fretibacterium sp.]